MRRLYGSRLLVTVVTATLILTCFSLPATAAQKVPIQFESYHGYTATADYLKTVAKTYPEITELLEIGESTMGRPIYVLVVSNQKNGFTIDALVNLRNKRKEGVKNVPALKPYQGKPGHWIGGAIHGNEYTGSEVCLYIIDKLVSGYKEDETITRMVDKNAFYICPVINPDGVFNSVERGIPQRANSMKKDDDGDGKINEDGPDDLDGDGHITLFRYKDPKGMSVMDDKDPRLMIRLRQEEKTDRPRYSVVPEDRDNDGDGKRGEDPESGIDLNRNFPEGWFTDDGFAGGSGDYPTSAPETHAVAEFFSNHRNILMGQFYHTSGGFTYRPMGTAPHSTMNPRDVAVFDFIMGKKYLEIIGEDVPEAWEKPRLLNQVKEKLKETNANKYAQQRGYLLPHGWRVSYDENRDRRYSYGMATDWAYKQYGIYSITTELWNPVKDIPGFPEITGESIYLERQRALLAYQDKEYGGKLFRAWKPFKHPELGAGEIGGWLPQHHPNNALPGKPLLEVCDKHWRFELFRAELLPDIVITKADTRLLSTSAGGGTATASTSGDTVTIQKGKSGESVKIIEITAVIENKGKLATHIAEGAQLSCLREDVVWLLGDPGKVDFLQGTPYQILGVLDGTLAIPGVGGQRASASSDQAPSRRMMFYPGAPLGFRRGPSYRPVEVKEGGTRREVKWVVAVKGTTPLKIVVSSQKGGTAVLDLKVK
ncbi:MAG: M14 family metallopeptidase [Candidatus Aminicenantes bacterium]|nr:M14 family metallopeptidase [Candidatus Aminicenantes bacterium]